MNEKLDYIDLWKHFEGRATEVKNAMFQVVTWVLGFATAVLGFIVSQCLVLLSDTVQAKQPVLIAILSLIGLLITLYATFLLFDFGGHIKRNFERADRARLQEGSFETILGSYPDSKMHWRKPDLPAPCDTMLNVVYLFSIVFFILFTGGMIMAIQILFAPS